MELLQNVNVYVQLYSGQCHYAAAGLIMEQIIAETNGNWYAIIAVDTRSRCHSC